MTNVLVLGAAGQLGTAIEDYKHEQYNKRLEDTDVIPEIRYFYTDVQGTSKKLDATNYDALEAFIEDNDIDIIVNCVAYTNVDKAEDDEETAKLLNIKIPRNLQKLYNKYKVKIIHISTDYVHDHFTKEDKRTDYLSYLPLSVYGKTKYLGEHEIKNGIIIRTSWLYYDCPKKSFKNFVNTIYDKLYDDQEIKVVDDQFGSPTYALDLAKFIVEGIEKNRFNLNERKIINYCNIGICSWYEFARAIGRMMDKEELVKPCKTLEYPVKAPRPKYSALSLLETVEDFGCDCLTYWQDSLSWALYLKDLHDI